MTGAVNTFLGSSGVVFSLSGSSIEDNDMGITGGAQVSISIESDGTVTFTRTNQSSGQLASDTDWVRPAAFGENYFVRATLTSGDTPSGTLDSWLATSTSRNWTVSRFTNGTTSSELFIEIAIDSGGSVVVASNTYTITAVVSGA